MELEMPMQYQGWFATASEKQLPNLRVEKENVQRVVK